MAENDEQAAPGDNLDSVTVSASVDTGQDAEARTNGQSRAPSSFAGLRPYQREAVDAILAGPVKLGGNAGKTTIALTLDHRTGRVHKRELVPQTVAAGVGRGHAVGSIGAALAAIAEAGVTEAEQAAFKAQYGDEPWTVIDGTLGPFSARQK